MTDKSAVFKRALSMRLFDPKWYKKKYNYSFKTDRQAFEDFLERSLFENINPSPLFDCHRYFLDYPDVLADKQNPLVHYIIHGVNEGRKFYSVGDVSIINIENIYKDAIESGLFDPDWYSNTYKISFDTPIEAFKDYLEKSKFSPVNPSKHFDGESYLRANIDVYINKQSPLEHYLRHGKNEGRVKFPVNIRWTPVNELTAEGVLSEAASNLKAAICLHIFYEDYIERFALALYSFPIKFDLLLTVANPNFVEHAADVFSNHPRVNHLEIRVSPNKGRNFGPLLVEYGKKLNEYDILCHLHSKKSLYSGKEQTQWADYLTEYLLKNSDVSIRMLNLFAENQDLGIYYPTTYWMMPPWVNHITMNASFMAEWEEQLGLKPSPSFLSYPAGGMFWARTKALKGLFDKAWVYEDFPDEPLPNDGSMLHALERVLGVLAEQRGYKQFFYYPSTAQFTTDKSYITSSYQGTLEQHIPSIKGHECITFDVFDTLVRREYTVPDYAKLKLGKILEKEGKVSSAQDFVLLRNQVESDLRKASQYQGNIVIEQIYEAIGERLSISLEHARALMQQEFELDLEMILPKNEMIELFNLLGSDGHKLWVISDTYYTRQQVGLMLRKAGVSVPYRLIVSSAEQKRKDNGTMWQMIKSDLSAEGIQRHIHIGDNVVADAQRPGDMGLSTFHVLHPMDKWRALGFPEVLQGQDALDENQILKWGKLISVVGRNPFIGV